MSTDPAKEGKLPSNEISQDDIQNFIEASQLDEQRVNQYKGYKKYEEWGDRWLSRVLLGSLGVLLAMAGIGYQFSNSFLSIYAGPVGTLISVLIILISLILGLSVVARWKSDLNNEKIAYHEIASSFELYRQDKSNLEPIFKRIETALEYFDKRSFSRISEKRMKESERYLSKAVDADEPSYIEEEFNHTFPDFMMVFSNSVANESDTSISDLSKQMDSAYKGDISLKKSAKSDAKDLVVGVFSGNELILSGGTIVLSILYFVSNVEVSILIGIWGPLVGAYFYFRGRDG